MSPSSEFLSAVYAGTNPDLPIRAKISDAVDEVTDSDYFTTNEGRVYVSTLTTEGVAFFVGLAEDADVSTISQCRLEPTAALRIENDLVLCWALEVPASVEDAEEIALALGMADSGGRPDLDKWIAVPPTADWELIQADAERYYTLADLRNAYCEAGHAPTATYGDAAVITRYDETLPQYQQPITVTLGPRSDSKHWKPATMPIGALIAKLCRHEEGKKDGVSLVLADMVEGQRLKNSVKTLTGFGLDIDVGTPSARIDAALSELGATAVRYTTHSHSKTHTEFKKDKVIKWAKDIGQPDADIEDDDFVRRFLAENQQWDAGMVETATYAGTDHTDKGIVISVMHAPMPKHRIIVPFLHPYEIAKEAPTQTEAQKKWAKLVVAFANKLGVPLDTTGTDPSRLFYLPRHKKDAPFEISLFGGPLFDWHAIEGDLENPYEAIAEEATRGTSKSKTEAGRKLGRWSTKAAHGFQIADVINDLCPDRIRSPGTMGYNIECPFDEDHSNSGDTDDQACFVVNAGEGTTDFFTCSCRHESCRDKTFLDMLGKMLSDGWFPRDVLEDDRYNAAVAEDAPNPVAAARIEKQDVAVEKHAAAIEALTKDSSDEEVEAALELLAESAPSELAKGTALDKIKTNTGRPITPLKKSYKNIATRVNREGGGNDRNKDGRAIFRHNGTYNFIEAAYACTRALQDKNRREEMPRYCTISSEAVRLMENSQTGKLEFQELTFSKMWADLTLQMTFVRTGESGDGAQEKVPEDVAKYVFEQAYRALPPAPEVLHTPIFLKDGALLITPKYHFDPNDPDYLNFILRLDNVEIPPVEEDPSYADVEEAVNWFRTELLGDFPFCDVNDDGTETSEASEANTFAMIITPFMRRMIEGRTPVFFVLKPLSGAGGTLLGNLPMWLFDGEGAEITRYSQSEEEMQKYLVAAVMSARGTLFFDDVTEFNNRELIRNITSAHVSGRILGSSTLISRPNFFNWIATGNNPRIGDEMERRTCLIRMNPKVPDIKGRRFRHPDVSGMDYYPFVMKNRGLAIHHVLTMIQYWISVGKPLFTDRRRSSFEDWSAKVGGVLQACGIEGFISNKRAAGQDADQASYKEFVSEWLNRFGVKAQIRPMELFNWASGAEYDIISGNNDDQKKSRFLSTLPRLEGRVFRVKNTDYMIRGGLDKEENTAYALLRVEKEGDEQDAA